MVNIRTIYSMTCHYQPLTGFSTSAFHRRVILLAKGRIQLFSLVSYAVVSYPGMLKGIRDIINFADTVNASNRKRKKKKLWYKIRRFDSGAETFAKLLRLGFCFLPNGNWREPLDLQCHTLRIHSPYSYPWTFNIFF